MFENNLRGGISVIGHRHAKANVPGTPDYNENEESSYILYFVWLGHTSPRRKPQDEQKSATRTADICIMHRPYSKRGVQPKCGVQN